MYLQPSLFRICLPLLLILFTGLSRFAATPSIGQVHASGPAPAPRLTAEQAVGLALNTLNETEDGFHLRHPRYTVDFTPLEVRLTPRQGGPAWQWQLAGVSGGNGGSLLVPVALGAVRPAEGQGPDRVLYQRGGLVEQYLLKNEHIEQQFILPEPLVPPGSDLVIQGRVSSQGELETTSTGWLWRTEEGGVSLGQVRVFDTAGQELPARLEVTTEQTRLVVAGPGLAQARYPVTIDPEIGTDDFRISSMGPDGDKDFTAWFPAVAYNSTNNEYLVVWGGNDQDLFVLNGYQIYGQRIDAATGAEVGPDDFLLSEATGIDGPYVSVTYNSKNNQYLVVWSGRVQPSNEYEIHGQRVDGATGAEIGANDFRLSDMGPDGNNNLGAFYPAVAYNPTKNEYLVVWWGDDDPAVLPGHETEIYGQRVNGATGAEVGTNDFRLSDMGPDGDADFGAYAPAIAYNSTDNEYLVVWLGDGDTTPPTDLEYEIFGQRVTANGTEIGPNDFRLSDMGPDGDPNFGALEPAVAYNSADNEYLVVWHGDDNTGSLVNNEYEIFGQRVAANGTELGVNDFRLSEMGADGTSDFLGVNPSVTYNSTSNEYMVVWAGSDTTIGDYEIFGQRVDPSGAEVGTNDFQLSYKSPDNNPGYWANYSGVAYNPADKEYLVIWNGTDGTPPMVDGEKEIFGQRYQLDPEIEVRGNGLVITNGDASPTPADHTHFGSIPLGQSVTRTFIIANQGDGSLHLAGSPPVSFSGPAALNFSLAVSPTTPISGGGSTAFQVRFTPTVSGSQVATVTLASNDGDENPYTFAIGGIGTNQLPLAKAGPDQSVTFGSQVSLNGSGSSDPDGHLPLSFGWSQSGGSEVLLSSPILSRPTFTAPGVATVLTFSLRVTDSFGLAGLPDPVVITVTVEVSVNRPVFLPVIIRH